MEMSAVMAVSTRSNSSAEEEKLNVLGRWGGQQLSAEGS